MDPDQTAPMREQSDQSPSLYAIYANSEHKQMRVQTSKVLTGRKRVNGSFIPEVQPSDIKYHYNMYAYTKNNLEGKKYASSFGSSFHLLSDRKTHQYTKT